MTEPKLDKTNLVKARISNVVVYCPECDSALIVQAKQD